jgi:hypothetical protein
MQAQSRDFLAKIKAPGQPVAVPRLRLIDCHTSPTPKHHLTFCFDGKVLSIQSFEMVAF